MTPDGFPPGVFLRLEMLEVADTRQVWRPASDFRNYHAMSVVSIARRGPIIPVCGGCGNFAEEVGSERRYPL